MSNSFLVVGILLLISLIFQKKIIAFLLGILKPGYRFLFGSKFEKWWPKIYLANKIIYNIGAITILLAFIISWDMQS